MRTVSMDRGAWLGPARRMHARAMYMSRDHGDPRGEGPGEFGHRARREGRHERSMEFERHERRGPRGHRGEEFGERGTRERHGRHDEGPFGPMHHGPRGRRGERGGPRIGRGDVRAATLLLLSEQPSHGYQIIQQVAERSGGLWQPSPGSVYPALQLLEDEGLVRSEEQEGRRVFKLTDDGQAYVAEHKDELSAIWQSVSDTVDSSQMELQDLFHQVGKAVRTVAQEGTASQLSAARELLSNTRRQLYLILAGEDQTSDSDR